MIDLCMYEDSDNNSYNNVFAYSERPIWVTKGTSENANHDHILHNMFKCAEFVYSGASLLRTLWDLKISPYYRGFLKSEVT